MATPPLAVWKTETHAVAQACSSPAYHFGSVLPKPDLPRNLQPIFIQYKAALFQSGGYQSISFSQSFSPACVGNGNRFSGAVDMH